MAITQQESTLGFDPLDRPIWGVAAIADAKTRGLKLYLTSKKEKWND